MNYVNKGMVGTDDRVSQIKANICINNGNHGR